MVAIRRINPEGGVGRLFKELTTQVNSHGTRASGNIVIRETLTTTDPETGVSTIFGTLPDGSTGLQEFVNDVTPPGQPSTPLLAPALGAIAVEWDGFETGGSPQPKDYDRTEIMYRTSGAADWTLGGVLYGATTTLVPNLVAGTRYDIRLVSYDKNGNASAPSTSGSEVAAAIMDNSDVADAIAEVREEAETAVRNSAAAQGSAKTAQDAADAAARDAASAVGMAAGASKTIFSNTAPTDSVYKNATTLWINTSGTPALNTPNRWDGAKWVAITDKTAVDAAAAAARAETLADTAAASAAAAATAAGNAQTAANGKNRTWYLNAAPAGNSHAINDLWFDSANGNRPMRWDGTAWVSAQDASIAAAKGVADTASRKADEAATAASTAQGAATTAASTAAEAASAALAASNLAATKGKVLAQATAPTGADANAQTLWIDTSGSPALNTPKRWVSGTTWTSVTDKAATDAAALATSKGKVIIQSTAPATADRLVQNMWIDTTNNANTPKRWDSTTSTWVIVTDKAATDAAAAAAKAQTDANKAIADAAAAAVAAGDALTSADGKATVRYAGTAPAGTGYKVNDLWFDSANGNRPMRWDGGNWTSVADTAIATAQGAADFALAAANGKNKTIFSTSDASGTTGYVAGDMWMKRDASGTIIAQWEFTTSWQKRTIGEAVLGNLSAGKITSGTIAADRLDANTIRAKILAADKINAADILVSGSITAASGVIGSLDAGVITSGTIAADRLDANTIRAKILAADKINAVDIIAAGSITATNGIIGSLDAAKISVGVLDAARIGAQSITADKIILGQGSNLITDPSFLSAASNTVRASRSTGTWTFGVDSTTLINSAKTTTATSNNSFMFGLVGRSAANAVNMVPVTPGDKYLFLASVHTNISAGVRWNVETVSAAGVAGYAAASPTNTAAGRRPIEYEYTVPAGVVAINPALACLTTGVVWTIDGGAIMAKKTEGNLIATGAIDGKVITGAVIQSVSAASRGIKITDTQFVAYSNTGVETLRLDGTNSILTGATVRTAASGSRVQMDSTGLKAFDTNNVEYLSVTNGTLNMKGNLEAAGIAQVTNLPVIATVGTATYLGGAVTSPGFAFVSNGGYLTTPPGMYTSDGTDIMISSGGSGASTGGRISSNIRLKGDRTISLHGKTVYIDNGANQYGDIHVADVVRTISSTDTLWTESDSGMRYVDVTQRRQADTPSGVVWGPGAPSWSFQMGAPMCRWAKNDHLEVTVSGVYTITYSYGFDRAVTARSFVGLEQVGLLRALGRTYFSVAEDTASVSITRNLAAGAQIKFVHYQSNTAGTNPGYYNISVLAHHQYDLAT